jgi:uncharacterized protein with von Willebrand factor type A (vWA) domain
MIKLRDLAAKAGRFLPGKSESPPREPQTGVVVSDRFDEITWRDVEGQARKLRELAADLHVHHDYADELVKDLFMSAYKDQPQLRQPVEPGRAVNRQVVGSLLDSPEFTELRRETVGDPYASAMAVLSQTTAIKTMLEQAEEAERAAKETEQAHAGAAEAARQLADAIAAAGAGANDDGEVDDDTAARIEGLTNAAGSAAQAASDAEKGLARAIAKAARDMHATARSGAQKAAEDACEESALMQSWGVDPGQLERMSFEERAALTARLRSGRMARFTALIGRFRQMAAAQRARRVENVPGEVVGIELGSDVSRLIPAEIANLAVPGLRENFITRFIDGRALQYQQRGETEAGKGAIVCAVDCSYSMKGLAGGSGISAEAWAKAFALSMLDQARAEKRDFAGILFSSEDEVKVFRFPAREPVKIAQLIDFAEFFWGGGTDFQAPLTAAMEILTGQYDGDGLEHGDIALVTDGIAWVDEEWMKGYQEAKNRLGFRTFGVRIGAPVGSILDALSDNVRAIEDLAEPDTAADIFRTV